MEALTKNLENFFLTQNSAAWLDLQTKIKKFKSQADAVVAELEDALDVVEGVLFSERLVVLDKNLFEESMIVKSPVIVFNAWNRKVNAFLLIEISFSGDLCFTGQKIKNWELVNYAAGYQKEDEQNADRVMQSTAIFANVVSGGAGRVVLFHNLVGGKSSVEEVQEAFAAVKVFLTTGQSSQSQAE